MRVLLDTNVIVSAILWDGPPSALLDLLEERGVVLLSSIAILEELEATFNKSKLQKYLAQKGKRAEELVGEFRKLVILVDSAQVPEDAVRDSDDVKVLAAAVAGNATHLVSGDKDLLTLGSYAGILIVNAQPFLEHLLAEDPSDE